MAKISLLHISDLHRSSSHPISNDALINSMEQDRLRYVSEDHRLNPDLIVVSGDLIHGKKGTTEDTLLELQRQYDEAYDFLVRLTEDMLDGNRANVVIIPGNHDIAWYHSFTSMTTMTSCADDQQQLKQRKELLRLVPTVTGDIRWSWDTFDFMKIVDRGTYDRRLEAFGAFYERFYEGKRIYSLNPSEQYDIFDYAELGVTIVGFNSCYNNDHCNLSGMIHPDCIARVSLELRKPQYRNRLFIATWHHNVGGKPYETHYMDSQILQNLLEANFSLGLHGHQHRTEVINEDFKLNAERKMVIFSAGSLCAGPNDLPTGETREYNVIICDRMEKTATVHVRKMMGTDFTYTIWQPCTPEVFPLNVRPRASSEVIQQTIPDLRIVEDLIHENEHIKAIEILEQLDFTNDAVRFYLLESYFELDDDLKIVTRYGSPRSDRETLILAESMWKLQRRTELKTLLEQDFVQKSSNPAVREMFDKYDQRMRAYGY